jgi:hypothetical protein
VSSSHGKYSSVVLQSDAIEVVEELFSRQIERSIGENAAINTLITGDAEARSAFWLLLNIDFQRSVFLTKCKRREFWPRIRSLVGSPPFSFLFPEDDFVLNASGITANRVHMAPTGRGTILSSGEIADGHFVDYYDRKYKIVAVQNERTSGLDPTSVMSCYRNLLPGKKVVLDLKLPRMKQTERIGIQKSTRVETKKSIYFPTPGEKIKLRINSKLASAASNEFVILVKSIQQRNSKSPVCRAFCVMEQ